MFVMFMDFKAVKNARLHHTYLFKERKSHEELSDIVQIHYIELPKTKELLSKPPAQLSELEFWVMLILAGEKKRIRKLLATLSDREEEMRILAGRTARNTTGRTQAGVGGGTADAILRRRNRKNRRHHATAA